MRFRSVTIESTLDATLDAVHSYLGREGFHVLTDTDLGQAFAAKLAVSFRPYLVLMVWNPAFSWRAVRDDDKAGPAMMVPVLVQEFEPELVEVSVPDPDNGSGTSGPSSDSDSPTEAIRVKVISRLAGLLDHLVE